MYKKFNYYFALLEKNALPSQVLIINNKSKIKNIKNIPKIHKATGENLLNISSSLIYKEAT